MSRPTETECCHALRMCTWMMVCIAATFIGVFVMLANRMQELHKRVQAVENIVCPVPVPNPPAPPPAPVKVDVMSTAAVVRQLKQDEQDLEWFPTTKEIIAKVAYSLMSHLGCYSDAIRTPSLLDIGAGDGRVLLAVQKLVEKEDKHGKLTLYAIEKAAYHLNNMPKEITVLGTDFEEQALADKPVGAIFCTPPYSQYEEWVLKILKEASTAHVYLVIPRRWRDNAEIQRAITARDGEVESLGEFDFEDADRRARAKVEIVHIRWARSHQDAFDAVVKDMLPELDVFDMPPEEEKTADAGLILHREKGDMIEYLVEAYGRDLAELLENYKAAMRIKASILAELGVSKDSVTQSIRLKIKSLKNRYWETLFHEMATITNRLATKQRAAFLESLGNKLSIDFTFNNVYSILIWVTKWSNDYFDTQLVELFETLSHDSNVVKYKSNDRVWTQNDWRYRQYDYDRPDGAPSHYTLEYKMVLTHGGICNSEWAHQREQYNGLIEPAFNLLQDIRTVANNLGFPCAVGPRGYQWAAGASNTMLLQNGDPLVEVRAFKNGNMHLRFNPRVMLAINIEAGRLLGWIRNPAEACQEMELKGDEIQQATALFGSQFKIGSESRQQLLGCITP